ncbi:MAG: methyltransferase [Spirochaetota bacterium]
MSEQEFLDALVFRRVQYRYRRRVFQFDLSQSLFSSAGVDNGTHLLLAMIAEELEPDDYTRIVDLGSGTGTLGIPLAGTTDAELVAIDRDARAVAFTERNAQINGIDRIRTHNALTLPEETHGGPELVLSNLPAKAGEPVLRMLVAQVARRATASGGTAAVVIVKPLAAFLAKVLDELGATLVAERKTANHAAAIFACPIAPQADDSEEGDEELPPGFLRTTATFEGPRKRYQIRTAYNLPEFDGLSYRTALAFDLLTEHRPGGHTLLYGCGQGHLAVGLGQRGGRGLELEIADRDLLALRLTAANAAGNGVEPASEITVATPGMLGSRFAPGSFAWVVVDDDPAPGSRWNEEILTLADLLDDAGRLLVVSRSTTVSRLERVAGKRLRQISERRMHGFRASLLASNR